MDQSNVPEEGRGFSTLRLHPLRLMVVAAYLAWGAPVVALAAQSSEQERATGHATEAAAAERGPAGEAVAAQQGRGGDAGAYRTPLAGAAFQAQFRGQTIVRPAWDRSHMTSLTLGGSLLEPRQGDTTVLPIGALFIRHFWERSRTRNVISLFVNELEYARTLGGMELIGQFENYTLPVAQTEVVDNEEIEGTSVRWGTLLAALGPGLRVPVAPYQPDNDLRLQLLGRVGYLYAQRSHDTGPDLAVPPNTLLYGARLRGRYDAITRNLLELPHRGVALGFDLDYLHRDRWRSLEPSASASTHRNYLQARGHLLAAGGLPGLSERNRLLFSLYGGTTSAGSADRYNAFVINGGPFPSEQGDLARVHYTGLVYQEVSATSYATAALTYRRQLNFFLYLSGMGSFIWADRGTVRGADQVVFRDLTAAAATISLDSGFFWNSSIYLAYVWDSEFIRGGRSGSGLALTWNKLF